MDTIDNETLRFVSHLIGPAGVPLLILAISLWYDKRELWRELKESREQYTTALEGVSKSNNNLADLIKERL